MNWIPLNDEAELSAIAHRSSERPQVIFKHSTSCSISSMAKNRLERGDAPEGVDFYYLDLIAYRNISGKIASDFDVEHESPQVLLIKDGKCIYDESHSGITLDEIKEQAGV